MELTVLPVAQYEPPVNPVAVSPPIRLRQIRLGRSPVVAVRNQPSARAAAVFADSALRAVLDVLDGRRPLNQLRPLLATGIADEVIAHSMRCGAPARLRRVALRIVDRDGDVAEVFGSYTRGGRLRAIAGRVERADVGGHRRWRLVALQLG